MGKLVKRTGPRGKQNMEGTKENVLQFFEQKAEWKEKDMEWVLGRFGFLNDWNRMQQEGKKRIYIYIGYPACLKW